MFADIPLRRIFKDRNNSATICHLWEEFFGGARAGAEFLVKSTRFYAVTPLALARLLPI
jgi:hypothetical protein